MDVQNVYSVQGKVPTIPQYGKRKEKGGNRKEGGRKGKRDRRRVGDFGGAPQTSEAPSSLSPDSLRSQWHHYTALTCGVSSLHVFPGPARPKRLTPQGSDHLVPGMEHFPSWVQSMSTRTPSFPPGASLPQWRAHWVLGPPKRHPPDPYPHVNIVLPSWEPPLGAPDDRMFFK